MEMQDLKGIFDEQGKLWTEFKGSIEQRLGKIEDQAAAVMKRVARPGGSPIEGGGESFGHTVAREFTKHAELFKRTGSLSLEIKAAGDPLTTTQVGTIMSTGGGGVPRGVLGIQSLLPINTVTPASSIDYVRFSGTVQGSAGIQATQGATKAALTPDFARIQQSAITIAGFAKASRQALEDERELPVLVDTVLRRSIGVALDDLLTGGGAGFSPGLEGLATAATSLVYTDFADAISEGVSAMQVAGYNPNAVCLHPDDWLTIQVKRGTSNDHPLSGSYLGEMPQSLRGLRVGVSASLTKNRFLLMDTSFVEILSMDGLRLIIGLDGSDFTKNLATMLAEVRIAPVFRAVGAARLITPKAA